MSRNAEREIVARNHRWWKLLKIGRGGALREKLCAKVINSVQINELLKIR